MTYSDIKPRQSFAAEPSIEQLIDAAILCDQFKSIGHNRDYKYGESDHSIGCATAVELARQVYQNAHENDSDLWRHLKTDQHAIMTEAHSIIEYYGEQYPYLHELTENLSLPESQKFSERTGSRTA